MKRTRWVVILPLLLLTTACQTSEEPADEEPADTVLTAAVSTTGWQCRNDLEISCDAEACEQQDGFTPMDVHVDDAGAMSVCAYSGCWEGTGTVVKSEPFIVFTGHNLAFSAAPDSEDGKENIIIVLDTADQVAILKAGAFAHPLRCEKKMSAE